MPVKNFIYTTNNNFSKFIIKVVDCYSSRDVPEIYSDIICLTHQLNLGYLRLLFFVRSIVKLGKERTENISFIFSFSSK
jgi:hypothetical protein